jgi:hypothetical protein
MEALTARLLDHRLFWAVGRAATAAAEGGATARRPAYGAGIGGARGEAGIEPAGRGDARKGTGAGHGGADRSIASPAAVLGREKAGSANFSFDVPLVSLPERGLDVSLVRVYNSRLWNKSTTATTGQNGNEIETTRLTYDADKGWPGRGWKLGCGQIESQGTAGFTLTDSDGKR